MSEILLSAIRKHITFSAIIAFGLMLNIVACEGQDTSEIQTAPTTAKQDDPQLTRKQQSSASTQHADPKTSTAKADKPKPDEDQKKEIKEIRSREIATLKEKIAFVTGKKMQAIQKRNSVVNMNNQIELSDVKSYNKQNNWSQAAAPATACASGSYVACAAGYGTLGYTVIKDNMEESEQRDEIATAKNSLNAEIATIDAEIQSYNDEIKELKAKLRKLIDPKDLI